MHDPYAVPNYTHTSLKYVAHPKLTRCVFSADSPPFVNETRATGDYKQSLYS